MAANERRSDPGISLAEIDGCHPPTSKNALKKVLKQKAVEKKKIEKATLKATAVETLSSHGDGQMTMMMMTTQKAKIIRSNQRKLPKLLFQCRGNVNGALKILGDAYPHLSFSVKEKTCAGGTVHLTYHQLLDILQGEELNNKIFDNREKVTFHDNDTLIIDGQSMVATMEILGKKTHHVPAALHLLRLAVDGVRHNYRQRRSRQEHQDDILHREDVCDKNELRQVYRATISLLGHAHARQIGTKHSSRLIMHLLHHHMPIISQIQPGTEIYHAAMNALGKIGECDVILELLNEMENSFEASMRNEDAKIIASTANNAPPVDKMAYQTAISSLARNNYCKEAIRLLHRMQSRGLLPDINTYNQLFIGIAKESGRNTADQRTDATDEDGDVSMPWHQVALQLLHFMECNQLRPTEQIYDSLISTCTNENEWNMAARIAEKAELWRQHGTKRKFSSINDDSTNNEADAISIGTPSESIVSANNIQTAAIAYFDNLKAFRKCGKSSEPWWEIGRYSLVSDDHGQPLKNIIIGIQPHKNPFRNGLSLVFFDEVSRVKLGRMLMRNESSSRTPEDTSGLLEPLFFSSLVGMEVTKERRGEGLSKIFVAMWLRICLDTNTYPRAAVMNKPLISRVLMGFNFVPQNGGSRVELIRLNNDNKTENGDSDYTPQFALYSPSAKSLKGLFSQRALRLQNIAILDHPPSLTSRQNASIIYVKSEFEHPIAILENAVQYNPPSSLLVDDNVSLFNDMEEQKQRSPCEIQRNMLSTQIDEILKTNVKGLSMLGRFEYFSSSSSLKVAFLPDYSKDDDLAESAETLEEGMHESKRMKRSCELINTL